MTRRSTRRRPARSLAAACVLAVIGPLVAGAPSSADDAGPTAEGRRTLHSSDGVVGPTAEPLPPSLRRVAARSNVQSFRVAPGLRFRQWDETDARGRVRAYLLRADLRKPGLSLRYTAPGRVAATDRLRRLVAQDGAVAGVNGDFFDIGDTGAPLGVGVDQRSPVHGPREGWNNSFVVLRKADARIGAIPMTATVVGRPGIRITHVNSPYVIPGGIGLYTPRWGTAPGYSVTDGAPRKNVRQVVVRRGKVVSNRRAVSRGTAIKGRMLIARGDGATALKRKLPVGTKVRLRVTAEGRPRVAISGNQVLLRDGAVVVSDDTELHPRTAVGIDHDTGKVLLLVIDGRQEHSRGYTMLELAELMLQLGAEDALNLDGGGSSTMVGRRPSGKLRVLNSPSDGQQRPVPNGLQLRYRP